MDLDQLRSRSEWSTVAEAARRILQNEPENVAAAVALTEARTFDVLANAGLYNTDNLTQIDDPAVAVLLREAGKLGHSKASEAERGCAVGQLLLLNGRPQQALEVLANVDAKPSREYLRAIVLKHRALLGGAYAALGDAERAFQTFNTVEVSDRTLEGMPEAARWAEVLYNKSVDTSTHNPDVFVRLQALRRYARAVRLGRLRGRPARLQELEELLKALAVRQPDQDFSDEIADVRRLRAESPTFPAPPTFPAASSPTFPSGVDSTTLDANPARTAVPIAGSPTRNVERIPNTRSPTSGPKSPLNANQPVHQPANPSDKPQKNSTSRNMHLRDGHGTNGTNGTTGAAASLPPASGETAAEKTIHDSAAIEKQVEQAVDHWRATQPLQPPYNIAVGGAVAPTRALLQQLTQGPDAAINRTFDSAVLMRLNTELLLALDRLPEAQAAFDTYVTYQALQLLKQQSGAHADPDSETGTAHIFGLMAAVVETAAYSADAGYEVVDRAAKLAGQLARVMPAHDAVAVGAAHGVLARCLELEAARAVGDDYFNERSDAEARHFEQALQRWPGDPPFHRARAQFLMRSAGPADTFAYLHPVLQQYPGDLPLAHLFVLALTAQDEYETALAVADAAVAEWPPAAAQTAFAKYQLLELLKTRAAIVESLDGATAALNELPDIMSAAAVLYPSHAPPAPPKDSQATSSQRAPQRPQPAPQRAPQDVPPQAVAPQQAPAAKASTNGAGTNGASRAVSQATAAPAKPKSSSNPNIAALWVWIAGLYVRAEQYAEAKEALHEARLGSDAADVVSMKGHIAQTPLEKYQRFTEALALDPFHLGAALGQAGVLVRHGRVQAGRVDEHKPSPLFRSSGEEMSQFLASLSGLEDLTTRYPGRSTPEAWYGLGALYEALGDTVRARDAFWRSVGLDEKTGVREVRV